MRIATTEIVLNFLIEYDDFATSSMISETTHELPNRVSAALHHLLKYKAVSVLTDGEKLWWYATPEDDTRLWSRKEVPEEIHMNRKTGFHRPRRKKGELPKRK